MTRHHSHNAPLIKKVVRQLVPDALLRKLRVRRNQRHFGDQNYESIFNQIHQENYWQNGESLSGGGSTIEFTESIRAELQKWMNGKSIESIVDVPCGDFNWMSKVNLPDGCQYIGIDIVPELIARNQETFSDDTHRFELGDVIAGDLPSAEVYFCRDVFIHFPNDAIDKAIANITSTGARHLIATTFPHITKMVDTAFPTSRLHNMRFHLGEPGELLKDFGNGRTDKYMGVWSL